ncbi:MAG: T9SS type A sorting domain-containing protein [Bacteroidales bacterium]|nr:T9SS type A sorting domain-containing protein [Bacteroidales bacterium]
MLLIFFIALFFSLSLKSQYLNPGGYPLITIPTESYKTLDHASEGILITIDTTIFHFFRLDPGIMGNHTGNGGRLVMRYSYDKGDTWSELKTIFNSPYDDRNVNGGLVQNNTILLNFRIYDAPPQIHKGYYYIYSTNKGETWSDTIKVNTLGRSSDTHKIIGNDEIGYYNAIYAYDYCEIWHSWNGVDWDSIVYIFDYRNDPLINFSEICFEYLGNGVFLGLFRNESNIPGQRGYYQVESYDFGKSWTHPEITNICDGFYCVSPCLFYDKIHNDLWIIACDRRGLNTFGHYDDAIWLYKMSPDEVLQNPKGYYPFLVFQRPKPSFLRFYGYPSYTKLDNGDYLVIFTECEYRNSSKGEWAYLYQFKILYSTGFVNVKSESLSSNEVFIFPNPAYDVINISLNNTHAYQIKIYNQLGDLLLSRNIENHLNVAEINLKSLPSGFYYCEIITNKGSIIKKFIKK